MAPQKPQWYSRVHTIDEIQGILNNDDWFVMSLTITPLEGTVYNNSKNTHDQMVILTVGYQDLSSIKGEV